MKEIVSQALQFENELDCFFFYLYFFNVYHSQHIIAQRYSQTFMKSDYTTLEKMLQSVNNCFRK